jgi:hypothetical protein
LKEFEEMKDETSEVEEDEAMRELNELFEKLSIS